MKSFISIVLCFSILGSNFCNGNITNIQEKIGQSPYEVVSKSLLVSAPNLFLNPDVALCKSILNPNHLKGEFGEALVGKFYLQQHLKNFGNWSEIPSRFGRQGLDNLFIKRDSLGRPRSLMVTEVKYGSSRLGLTKDGRQIGFTWTANRLKSLGNRYIGAAQSKNIIIKKQPSLFLKPRHQIIAELPNGKKSIFWRQNKNQNWRFDGNKSDLNIAQKKMLMDGKYIKAAGENRITFRRRLINIKPNQTGCKLIIKDAAGLDKNISQGNLKQTGTINIKYDRNVKVIARNEIAQQIKNKAKHLSDSQCKQTATKIVRTEKPFLLNKKYSYSTYFAKTTIGGGLYGSAISIGAELLLNGENTNFEELTKKGSLGFIAGSSSVAANQLVTKSLLRNKVANSIVAKTATSLGVNPSLLGKALGTTAGAGIATLVFSYGEYFMGYCDSYTANKNAVSGLTGVAAGAAAWSGTLFLVSSFGTAGTGTAIASLSGATAANASFALLGGGTLASGGLGAAGGLTILSGGTAIIIIGATAAAMYGFTLHEKSDHRKLMKKELNYYLTSDLFEKQAEKMFPYVSN